MVDTNGLYSSKFDNSFRFEGGGFKMLTANEYQIKREKKLCFNCEKKISSRPPM